MTDAKKSLGQHWLYDKSVLQHMVNECDIVDTDTVIEIGPGLGTLTAELLGVGAKVIAIEFDNDLLPGLRQQFSKLDNFELMNADVLKVDFTKLPKDYKVVANIPYYLTSHLLRIISDMSNKPICAALLMQKEVTQRVCAKAGDMSVLSVAVQLEYKASESIFVPAELFSPPPKVDSMALHLERCPHPILQKIDKKSFMRLVKAGFAGKRKTLRNSISAGLGIEKEAAETALKQANIDPGRRAQALSLDEWFNLYSALGE